MLIYTRAACVRILLTAIVTVVVAWGPAPGLAECVWQPVDSGTVGAAVASWFRVVTGSERAPAWSLGAGKDAVSLKLGDGGNVAVVTVALSPECNRTVKTSWASGRAGWFSDDDAARLVESLKLSSVLVESGPAVPDPVSVAGIDVRDGPDWKDLALLLLALAYVLFVFMVPADRRALRVVDALILVVLMTLAAWTLFDVPFSTDAQILRVAFAARDIFADWNHPFLPYLLNRPAALLSADPVILRIVPFIWAVLEAFLFSVAARQIAGRPAGALLTVWMAASVRLTMGMIDLSDWNLAGVFLALMVLWLIDYSRRGLRWKFAPVPALLILGGCFSSYMMIVPAALLVLFLVVEWLRHRISVFQPATAAVAVMIAGAMVVEVFSRGSTVTKFGFTDDLAGMLRAVLLTEPPLGLSVLMPFLIIAGLFTRRFRASGVTWGFCVATLAASIAALAVALVYSAINGAYYFGLCKGLCYLPAAVFVAVAVEWTSAGLSRTRAPRWLAGGLVPAVIVAAVFFATFRVEAIPRCTEVDGIGRIGDFVEQTGRGEIRVFSNDSNAPVLMLYSEVLAGRMDIGTILEPRGRTWVHRTVTRFGIDKVDCASMPDHFLLLWRNLAGNGTDPGCRPLESPGCVEMFVDQGAKPCAESRRAFCYYDCHGGSSTGAAEEAQ